uniref:WD_REPEATS_REGION domain-containing protein n=1 Tax=Anisakis simplex TaxID=6269 RepID=A0A0M3KDK8_ANISI
LSDHVRIYSFGNTSRSPITLKHPRQKSVTHMTWKPFDTMLLAVACADAILIWRLNPKTFTNRVYDRNTNWSEERWSGLHGGCISAVWSNDSTYLLFANRDQPCIYSVRFATRIELSQDGNQILRSYGAETQIEVYNLCEVSYANDDETRHIGGSIHNMQLSPDGKRLAVSFKSLFRFI